MPTGAKLLAWVEPQNGNVIAAFVAALASRPPATRRCASVGRRGNGSSVKRTRWAARQSNGPRRRPISRLNITSRRGTRLKPWRKAAAGTVLTPGQETVMPSKPPARRPVSVTVNGRPYRGTYVVVGSTITVSALGQSETTQIGRMPIEDLARLLLAGIVHLWTPMPA